ncbi:hypothetical protein [Streptomyces sp. ISL-94]|uniref:hypothetical protein n=1 Tax=Streptomyces sp. ISL-94 TaxID=2819190 RepID=UPI001BE853F6|nr:hypothetical protein [Streptomyces sp. ISL-94]MBT2479381.1 hypothetical protein [Streptomyces sp. ISL-94]
MTPRAAAPSRAKRFCIRVSAVLAGLAAGCAAIALAARAREYCGAGTDAGGRFELSLTLLPLTAAFATVALVVALLLDRRPVALQLGTVLVVPAGLTVLYFALRGTLDGYPGDPARCGPDNVPPWWPGWLPA